MRGGELIIMSSEEVFEKVKAIIIEQLQSAEASVTMEAISDGLRKQPYLTTYKKKGQTFSIVTHGLFDKEDNDKTREVLYPFLRDCFQYIHDCLPDEWEKGKSGVLLINNSVQAIIMLLYDIVLLLKTQGKINPMLEKPSIIVEQVKYYLDPLIDYISHINSEQTDIIKRSYGSTGPVRVWRYYQKAISDKRADFIPEGLMEWWKDNAKQFNNQSGSLIRDISKYIKDDFEDRLKAKYGDEWLISGIPKPVFLKAEEPFF